MRSWRRRRETKDLGEDLRRCVAEFAADLEFDSASKESARPEMVITAMTTLIHPEVRCMLAGEEMYVEEERC